MSWKNTAMKFFMAEEGQEEQFSRPQLVSTSGRLDIVVRTPKTFEDVKEYADYLMSGSAIMISFDAVDGAMKNSIFDYLNGVAYIVRASVSRVNEDLLLYAPEQVDVNKEVAKKGMRSWLG